nr:hypothetical protein [Lysinibacillus sp. SDF0063]
MAPLATNMQPWRFFVIDKKIVITTQQESEL